MVMGTHPTHSRPYWPVPYCTVPALVEMGHLILLYEDWAAFEGFGLVDGSMAATFSAFSVKVSNPPRQNQKMYLTLFVVCSVYKLVWILAQCSDTMAKDTTLLTAWMDSIENTLSFPFCSFSFYSIHQISEFQSDSLTNSFHTKECCCHHIFLVL